MYFESISANEWVFKSALEQYLIEFREEEAAEAEMRRDLKAIEKNPNSLKSAKDTATLWLSNFTKFKAQFNPPKQSEESATACGKRLQGTGGSSTTFVNHNKAKSIVLNQGNSTVSHHGLSSQSIKKRKIFEQDSTVIKDEMEQLFNKVNEEEDVDDYAPEMLRASNIKVIQPSEGYIIQDNSGESLHVTSQFQKFQDFVIQMCNRSGLLLETHPHHILSLSSILLLKPNQYHQDLLVYFTPTDLKLIRHDVLCRLCGDEYEDLEFDPLLLLEISKIIKDLLKMDGNRLKCIKSLAELIHIERTFEADMILTLINYVQKLPDNKAIDPLGEIEVCAGYLDPLLSCLFGDSRTQTTLRWANKVTDESKKSLSNVNKQRRPDAVMAMLNQCEYGDSRGFGEVKIKEALKDSYSLTRDLVRLSVFSKESIDINDMKANINFQAIGEHVFFYAECLVKDGVYVMVEIDDVMVPLCLSDLIAYLSQFDKLKKISTLYHKSCIHNPITIDTKWKRKTLDSPVFEEYVNGKGCKRNKTTLVFN